MRELDELVVAATTNDEKFEQLVTKYQSFIMKCASKYSGKYITMSDDEWSVALLAFSEAVHSYKLDKGNFIKFSELVIQRRLMDNYKANKKFRVHVLSAADLKLDNDDDADHERLFAAHNYFFTKHNESLKDEIDAISQVFQKYGFSFFDLVKVSPKAEKTKTACGKVVAHIFKNLDILNDLKKSKQLPIKKIEKNLSIPRKILDRHRKYIIAAVEILSGEYPYLSEYMWPIRKELSK